MKKNKLKSNFKCLVAGLAIAVGAISWQPANALDNREEIPEIGWSSKLTSMGLNKSDNLNKVYNFYCQPAAEDLSHAPIWGTNTYTVNSGICSAAVHSGTISVKGGVVSVELLPGREFYTGSSKHEVISKDRSGTEFSFAFVGETATNNSNLQPNAQDPSSSIKKVMVNSVQKGVEKTIERAIVELFN